MHFELSITEAEEALRGKLYDALYAVDEAKIQELMSSPAAEAVRALPTDGETPYLARARRTISERDGQTSVLRAATVNLLDGQTLWARVVRDLEGLLESKDDAGIYRWVFGIGAGFPYVDHHLLRYSYTTVAPWTTLVKTARDRFRPNEVGFNSISQSHELNPSLYL